MSILAAELSPAIEEFYRFSNYKRYHEALGNVTAADAYFGRAEAVLSRRIEIKQRTMSQKTQRYDAWEVGHRILTSETFYGDSCLEPEQSKRVSLQKTQNVPFL